ncbi:hypothetical protein QCA50_001008 [Cerrena zonata]|uniref:Uncharacterized protein n=1 Tax=Cerrena zonata TaxID=2478898 RepID=A0AAW0H0Q1_9APHY
MVFVNNSTATTVGIDKLFHPTVLRDQMAFESAIGSFEQKLFDPGVDKAKLVDELMSVNNLFELIFSAVSEPSAECIKKSIFQSYPMTASGFNGSQTQRLLDELAKFVAARSLMPSADDSFRSVQSGTQALISISTTFNNTLDSVTEQPSPHVGPARRRKNVFHASQRDQKKARAKTYPAIDSKPFMSLNVDVPTNKVEADSLTREILTTQRRLLEQYLSILRNPDLYDAIKSACVPASLPEPEPELGVPVVSGSGLTEDQSTTATPSAFYMVQSLRAALHFDSPEGFGEWRILIPSSAQKDLRDTRKKDPVHFDTIVTKIKELSTGYFSKDNQKMLNRSPDGIPIFEAKVTPDKCLVYQIDCDQDFETGVECQGIVQSAADLISSLNPLQSSDSMGSTRTLSWPDLIGKHLPLDSRKSVKRTAIDVLNGPNLGRKVTMSFLQLPFLLFYRSSTAS